MGAGREVSGMGIYILTEIMEVEGVKIIDARDDEIGVGTVEENKP